MVHVSPEVVKETDRVLLNDAIYDILRRVVTYWLPALGALYFGIAEIWNLPYAEQIVGTIACVTTFLGVLLGISRFTYDRADIKFDGDLVVDSTQSVDQPRYLLSPNESLEEMQKKGYATLKVHPSAQ